MKHRIVFETLPPSVNARYGVFNGRMILKAEYRNWLLWRSREIYAFCQEKNITPIEKYTVVELFWTLPNHRSDHHNFEKPVFDAMQRGGVFKNDRYILNRTMEVKFSDKGFLVAEFEIEGRE